MEKPTGGKGAMEYAKFRQNRQGETVVAVSNEDEIKVKTITVTASGNTLLLESASEKSIRVRGFMFSREGSNSVTLSLRQGETGDLKYVCYLKDDGTIFSKDLSHLWLLDADADLYVYASGACNVHVTIEYDGPADSKQEGKALSDTMSIADSITNLETGKKVTDAITITETEIETAGRELTDSMDIVDEALTWTESAEIELTDSVSISTEMGGTRFLALTDAITFAESSTRIQS